MVSVRIKNIVSSPVPETNREVRGRLQRFAVDYVGFQPSHSLNCSNDFQTQKLIASNLNFLLKNFAPN